MAEPTVPLGPRGAHPGPPQPSAVPMSFGAAQRLPRNTIQTVVTTPLRQTSPFTPRDGGVTWAAPIAARSSSVPRVASAQGLVHPGPVIFASGATTPGRMPGPLPYLRTVAPVAQRPQFVRIGDEASLPGASAASGAAPDAVQKVREELEAKMAAMQSRWEERFCEAVDFWHQAWSTTTSVVKDCNTHCVKLSEVLEASLDQLGQKSLEVANLQTRVQLLEAASGQVNSPTSKGSANSPKNWPSATGTSDSFKKLSEELASFADYVSEQSWRMRSDLTPSRSGAAGPNGTSPPSGAGALPRQEVPEEVAELSNQWR